MRLAALLILCLGLAACAPPPPPPEAPPPPASAAPPPPLPAQMLGPATVQQTAIGPVLADAQGMTLYTFDKDKPGVSSCYGKCATAWPPFRASRESHPGGPWTIIHRRGGERQWAYKDEPLYTYFKDHAPGQTTGDGFRGVWHAARP